jgi:hypothetical protein
MDMTFDFWGAAAVLASVVTFVATWNFAKIRPVVDRLLLLGLFAILSIPAGLFALYYWHIVPEMGWFYTLRSWTGSEFLAVFIGCAGGCIATFLPRWAMGFPLFGTLVVTSIPYLKPLFSPLAPESMHDRWSGNVCLQSTLSTCGPASLCTILAAFGYHATEKEIARQAYSYTGGTEAWYLARVARHYGLHPKFDFRSGLPSDLALPAIIGIRRGAVGGHFLAVLSMHDGRVTFADPLGASLPAIQTQPIAEFRRLHSLSGFHLSIQRR